MPQLVTFHLDKLRCIVEKDAKGGSEPYLWVTYFAVDGRNISQAAPVSTFTPTYDEFRSEFPDNVKDGQIINVPVFIANFSTVVDPGPLNFMMAGCIAVLLEEDDSPLKAMLAGRRAFADAIHQELNKLVKKRILSADRGPVTPEEIDAIRKEVEPKVKSAVKKNLTLGQKLFDNQDDVLGFAHVNFIGEEELVNRSFEFPELAESNGDNRFILNGSLTVGPEPPPTVDLCKDQRAAVQAKKNEINGFQIMRQTLQKQLQTASPQAKPAIIKQITALAEKITKAEAELPPLVAALKACETHHHHGTHGIPPVIIGRG